MTRYGKNKAQTILEFSAAMVMLCLIMYGMIEIFRWGMMDMVDRRIDHEQGLTQTLNATEDTEKQLNPNFHQLRPMDTLWYKSQTTP